MRRRRSLRFHGGVHHCCLHLLALTVALEEAFRCARWWTHDHLRWAANSKICFFFRTVSFRSIGTRRGESKGRSPTNTATNVEGGTPSPGPRGAFLRTRLGLDCGPQINVLPVKLSANLRAASNVLDVAKKCSRLQRDGTLSES